jgi:hypothetical protein
MQFQEFISHEFIILLYVSKSMFLQWFSISNECRTSLVTGLLRHISMVRQSTETEILEVGISFVLLP